MINVLYRTRAGRGDVNVVAAFGAGNRRFSGVLSSMGRPTVLPLAHSQEGCAVREAMDAIPVGRIIFPQLQDGAARYAIIRLHAAGRQRNTDSRDGHRRGAEVLDATSGKERLSAVSNRWPNSS